METRHVVQPATEPGKFLAQPADIDAHHIFEGKNRDHDDIENIEAQLPSRARRQRLLGLQCQRDETQQDQNDDQPVDARDAALARFRHQFLIQPVTQALLNGDLVHYHRQQGPYPETRNP